MPMSNAGRPKGSNDTPKALLQRGMRESARIAAKARSLLEKQLGIISKALENPEMDSQHAANLVEATIAILGALDKTIESSGKLLVTRPNGKEIESSSHVDAAQVLAEITKGKKS